MTVDLGRVRKGHRRVVKRGADIIAINDALYEIEQRIFRLVDQLARARAKQKKLSSLAARRSRDLVERP